MEYYPPPNSQTSAMGYSLGGHGHHINMSHHHHHHHQMSGATGYHQTTQRPMTGECMTSGDYSSGMVL
jgi:hypothetical protein